MKAKIIKILLPPIFGVLAVLGILVFFNLVVHNGDAFNSPDNGFFSLFVPIVTLIALIIQITLTLPFWEKFKANQRVWGMTVFQFTSHLCVISGLAFGLFFWDKSFGLKDLVLASITGIFAFALYWAVNLLTLKKMDRL